MYTCRDGVIEYTEATLIKAYRQCTRNWRLVSNLHVIELTEMPTSLIPRQQTFSDLLVTTYSNRPGYSDFVEDRCEHTDNHSAHFAQSTFLQASLCP